MNQDSVWMWVAIGAATIVVVSLAVSLWRSLASPARQRDGRATSLHVVANGLVIVGLFFTADRLVGYGLMGLGVALSLVTTFRAAPPGPGPTAAGSPHPTG